MSRHRKTTTPLQHPHGPGDWRKPPLLNLTQLTAAPCDVNVLLTNIESTPTLPKNPGGQGGECVPTLAVARFVLDEEGPLATLIGRVPLSRLSIAMRCSPAGQLAPCGVLRGEA